VCRPSDFNTLGGYFFCLPTIYQISTTSWACYEQDLFILCFFSFGEFVFWLKAPISATWGKKKLKLKKKREYPNAIRTCQVVLVHHNRQTQVNWKQSKGALALAFFCHYELWCHIAFSGNERPIPPHFPLLRIYFSLRSTSVGHHPQELKIAKRYSKLNRKEYDF